MSEFEAGKEVHYHTGFGKNAKKIFVTLAAEHHYAVMIEAESKCGPGCVADIIYNWETAETMALEGAKLIAVDPGNQERIDIVIAQYNDCFGNRDYFD